MNELLKESIRRGGIPRLLLMVTDRKTADKVSVLFRRCYIPQHYQFLAAGTAASEWIDLIGLGESEKAVSICLVPSSHAKALLKEVAKTLKFDKPGKGIACIIPISGASHPMTKMIDEETKMELKKKLEYEIQQVRTQYDMIWAIFNQGYSEEVMEAARKAGAMGGTVIHARRVGLDAPMKFWGITLQEEREILFILTDRVHKKAIMQSISGKFGIATDAQGMVFALPVEEIEGIDTN